MLTHIDIRDFAIIDRLDLGLARGMTVLSGETGAGKSILVDALGLVLGDRADSAMVRHGQSRAEVTASFELAADAQRWLAEQDLDGDDGECLLRRTVTAEGRSRAYVNGRPVPVQTLRDLGERLVDIHGQHAHQSLLRAATQRLVLDEFGGHRKLLGQVGAAYRDWRSIADQREQLATAANQRQSRLDLLRYQSGELAELDYRAGEFATLDQQRRTAANAARLLEAAADAYEALDGDRPDRVNSVLSHAQQRLAALTDQDPRLQAIVELIDGALIQASEAAGELRGYLEALEVDPRELEATEQRLQAITDLARKHQVDPDRLPQVLATMQTDLADLENLDQRLAELDDRLAAAEAAYRELADRLSGARRRSASRLGREVTDNMQRLGMTGGRFLVQLAGSDQPAEHGLETVELQVSANPGQPPRALARVASGGELSRIALALQVLISERLGVPTLVFDEVDVGIGGGVAEIVGRLLRRLGGERQVLCVTHLPQVAAQGHQHLFISKHKGKARTGSTISTLTDQDRVDELARMLGGVEITDTTRRHAAELLSGAQHGD